MSHIDSVWAGYSKLRHVAAALAAVIAFTAGCGGQATEGEGSGSTASGAGTSGTGASGNGSGSGTKTPNGGLALGECVKGFDLNEEPWRPCAWIADGLCYDTKPAACACACPRNRNDSVCSSSFEDGPDGRVEVHCQ